MTRLNKRDTSTSDNEPWKLEPREVERTGKKELVEKEVEKGEGGRV